MFDDTVAPVKTGQLDLHVRDTQARDNNSFMLRLEEELDRQPLAEAAERDECGNSDICYACHQTRLNDLLGDKIQKLRAVCAQICDHFL